MELQGRVIAALPERSGVSQRGEWKSQEFVIEIPGQYPRHLVFNVFGADRLSRFNIQVGQDVLVAFDIDAHEWQGRWFNDIRAYDVRQVDMQAGVQNGVQSATTTPVNGAAPVQPVNAAPADTSSSGDSDLPF